MGGSRCSFGVGGSRTLASDREESRGARWVGGSRTLAGGGHALGEGLRALRVILKGGPYKILNDALRRPWIFCFPKMLKRAWHFGKTKNPDSRAVRILSGWQDSNLRPPGPKPGAMTGLRYTPKAGANI
jgi:hypothetical protein